GARVPGLDRREEALLGGEDGPEPVPIDAAALEHHARAPAAARDRWLEARIAESAGGAGRHRVVEPPLLVLGPRVEAEAGHARPRARARLLHEDRAEVARPRAVGGEAEEVDLVEVGAAPQEDAGRLALHGRVADDEPHALPAREEPHDRGVDP